MRPFTIDAAVQVLSRTPRALDSLLRGLDESWTRSNYGPDTFSPFDVVGHLIHGENADWIPRARIILEYGESRAFDPFDRYAMYQQSSGRSMDELLDQFASLREENLRALRELGLGEAQLELRGMHPTLGPVTMRQLLASWVAHDLNHVHQVAKCLAYQYRDETGPWGNFMGVFAPTQLSQ